MTLSNLSWSVYSRAEANRGIWLLITSSTSVRSLTPRHSRTFSMREMTTERLRRWLAGPPQTIWSSYLSAANRSSGSPHFRCQSGLERSKVKF